MLIRLEGVLGVLSQLISSQGAPHTAFVVDAASGAVIAARSTPTTSPFPPASLSDRSDEERAQIYAALATSKWEEENGLPTAVVANGNGLRAAEAPAKSLMIESELGRIVVSRVGGFLVVLVGTEVSPWAVLNKKVLLGCEALHPLAAVSS